jgi:uncharacterized membrane protein SpoIIM required for sporulation
MDYQTFVAARQEAWAHFELQLEQARRRPRGLGHDELEQLAVSYRLLLHDRALARARFAGTGAEVRLGRLAVEGTYYLRRDASARPFDLGRILQRTLPDAFRSILPELAVMALLFVAAVSLGLATVLLRPEAAPMLLGPERLAGLREGHLWTESLTTSVPPAYSSSAIATNNMSVALLAWAGGALAGLGALYVTLLNGLLLGATLAVTVHYGMAGRLGEFIAAHGPLEITLILVCAAAGASVGRAWVVASDEPRGVLLRRAASRALVVLLACLPAFLVLGVVEAFVSPDPALGAPLKLALGLSLVALFLLLAARPGQGEVPDER